MIMMMMPIDVEMPKYRVPKFGSAEDARDAGVGSRFLGNEGQSVFCKPHIASKLTCSLLQRLHLLITTLRTSQVQAQW